jgi:hypothetical protein
VAAHGVACLGCIRNTASCGSSKPEGSAFVRILSLLMLLLHESEHLRRHTLRVYFRCGCFECLQYEGKSTPAQHTIYRPLCACCRCCWCILVIGGTHWNRPGPAMPAMCGCPWWQHQTASQMPCSLSTWSVGGWGTIAHLQQCKRASTAAELQV